MMIPQNALDKVLHALVEEYGYKTVELALAQLPENAGRSEVRPDQHGRRPGSHSTRPATTKLLATDQLARAQLSEAQLVSIRELAVRFDRKEFLPTVADVREFLTMMGQTPGAMKDRTEAFRRLLKLFTELTPERLEEISRIALHSGPSQLGPLSDAISAAATSLSRHREPSLS